MDLTPYVETMRAHLVTAAAMGDEQTRDLARRLGDALEPGARLALTQALSAFAAEVTAAWGAGIVEIRLHDGEPDVVVTPVAAPSAVPESGGEQLIYLEGDADGSTARISLRMPEPVKNAAENRASDSALSLNAWLNRTISQALTRIPTPPDPPAPPGRRLSGFHHS